jgi:hypothetical protein
MAVAVLRTALRVVAWERTLHYYQMMLEVVVLTAAAAAACYFESACKSTHTPVANIASVHANRKRDIDGLHALYLPS